mmetsp:Transcript_19006/g.23135  ORF Transcript_19006/g.23135 Transcript_19006/m.23135 type:complete len:105 (-) Transcript_19006:120-434(-)
MVLMTMDRENRKTSSSVSIQSTVDLNFQVVVPRLTTTLPRRHNSSIELQSLSKFNDKHTPTHIHKHEKSKSGYSSKVDLTSSELNMSSQSVEALATVLYKMAMP